MYNLGDKVILTSSEYKSIGLTDGEPVTIVGFDDTDDYAPILVYHPDILNGCPGSLATRKIEDPDDVIFGGHYNEWICAEDILRKVEE